MTTCAVIVLALIVARLVILDEQKAAIAVTMSKPDPISIHFVIHFGEQYLIRITAIGEM